MSDTQAELHAFLDDPETFKRAAEGSMAKRQAVLDQAELDEILDDWFMKPREQLKQQLTQFIAEAINDTHTPLEDGHICSECFGNQDSQDELRDTLRNIDKMITIRTMQEPLSDSSFIAESRLKLTDAVIDEILAHTQKLVTEARIAETDLWLNEWGMGDKNIGDGSWEDYHEHRIAELTKDKEGGK